MGREQKLYVLAPAPLRFFSRAGCLCINFCVCLCAFAAQTLPDGCSGIYFWPQFLKAAEDISECGKAQLQFSFSDAEFSVLERALSRGANNSTIARLIDEQRLLSILFGVEDGLTGLLSAVLGNRFEISRGSGIFHVESSAGIDSRILSSRPSTAGKLPCGGEDTTGRSSKKPHAVSHKLPPHGLGLLLRLSEGTQTSGSTNQQIELQGASQQYPESHPISSWIPKDLGGAVIFDTRLYHREADDPRLLALYFVAEWHTGAHEGAEILNRVLRRGYVAKLEQMLENMTSGSVDLGNADHREFLNNMSPQEQFAFCTEIPEAEIERARCSKHSSCKRCARMQSCMWCYHERVCKSSEFDICEDGMGTESTVVEGIIYSNQCNSGHAPPSLPVDALVTG